MAVEESLRQLMDSLDMEPDIEVEAEGELDINPEDLIVEETEDGGALVMMDEPGMMEQTDEIPHSANLADYVDNTDLGKLASDLISSVVSDKDSRSEWERTYTDGLRDLGIKKEERSEPWPGASAVFHPLLSEAVVRFQAQTINEIFPAQGPVKSSIVGTPTGDKEKQAKRVQEYMNYFILNEMDEYRPETEKMLFSLPLAGSAFRKVYFDPSLGRPVSMFIPAEDVLVNYAAADLKTAERVTHVMKKSDNDVLKMQISGFYRMVDLTSPGHEQDMIQEKLDELTGRSRTTDTDNRRVLLEIHTETHIPGIDDEDAPAPPYVITIDKTSREVLSIYRNWEEGDPFQAKRMHFVHYEFIPGLGFYGFGLTHLIGGMASASTSILRQLIDAGTLSNLPGGLKARGMRIKGDDTPILPGEFRDVDVPSGTIKDNITFLPYKEPSATLYQLLTNLVEDGRRFASMADLKVADMNQEAPVGTTLAIMERAMKVQSSIQSRIHAGLRQEFRMLARVIATQTEPAYPYDVEEGQEIKAADFDERVDIIPVSDPNASTMAQRIMQYQAVLQLASQAPQIYDLQQLHRQVIDTLGVANADKIVPMDEELPPADPITENASILNLGRVQAHEYQDHEAHLRVHRVLMQDPQVAEMLQNSQSGPAISAALDSHVREHMAFMIRKQVEDELGTPLPPVGEPLPEDLEKRLSTLTADAAEMMLGKKQAQAQAEKNAAMMQDPVIQQKEKELEIKLQDVQRKARLDEAKIKIELEKLRQDAIQTQLQLEADREKVGIDATVDLLKSGADAQIRSIQIGKEIGEALENADIARMQKKESGE